MVGPGEPSEVPGAAPGPSAELVSEETVVLLVGASMGDPVFFVLDSIRVRGYKGLGGATF